MFFFGAKLMAVGARLAPEPERYCYPGSVQTVPAMSGDTVLAYDEDTVHYVVSDSTGNAYAVRFTPVRYPFTLTEVGLYISAGAGDPAAAFDLTVYRDGKGRPDSIWATRVDVRASQPGAFNWFDVSDLGIVAHSGDFYAGIVFKTAFSPYVGTDVSPPVNHRSYNCADSTWANFDDLGSPWADSMDLMIRARGIAADGLGEQPPARQSGFALTSRPNPFHRTTQIRFHIPADQRISLNVYDPAGRLVRTLVDGWQRHGTHTVTWNGTDRQGCRLNPGIYFFRLAAPKTVTVHKGIVIH